MNIVIVGRFSPPVLACIRSWGRSGNIVGFVCIDDGENRFKPCSKYLNSQIRISKKDLYNDSGIIKTALFLEQFNADALSSVDDNIACWLSDNAFRFDKKISLLFSSSKVIRKILSKKLQNQIAREVGLKVLPEYIIESDNIDKINIPSAHFPLCLRPSEPNSAKPSFKVKLIHSYIELQKFIKSIKIEKNGKIVGQPFKNLPNMVIHGVRTKKGEAKYFLPFIVERKLEGVTLTLRYYPELYKDLIDKCRAFVQSLELIGNFHFEFLFDPKTQDAFFLEINLRFGGTTAKVSACGYDEPMYALESYGLQSYSFPPKIKNRTVSNKQALLKYMAKAVTKRLTALDYPDESVRKKLAAGIKGLFLFYDEVLCLDDLKGGINLYLNNVMQNFKRFF